MNRALGLAHVHAATACGPGNPSVCIDLHVRHRLASADRQFTLDMRLASGAQRIALFGPSGAGKTLTIKAIAGLLRPQAGYVRVAGRTLFDAAHGVWLAPQRRRVAYLFQEYALFPHLTVAQNIAFGLTRGWCNAHKTRLAATARRWVEAFELTPLLASKPHELSGGQRQRVALARALAVEPDILLLDEPFSALQTELRQRLRHELAGLQAQLQIPMILITHDLEDVWALSETVFELRGGRVAGEYTSREFRRGQQ